MRVVFERGKQKELFTEYKLTRNLSWRAMARALDTNWRTFRFWRDGNLTLPKEIYLKLISDLPELSMFEKYILEEREDKWWRKITPTLGWKATEKKLLTDKIFRERWKRKCRKGGKKSVSDGYIKGWEVGFRKVSRRRATGPKGEIMFNDKEKNIAEFLLKNNITYVYEPMIKINSHTYFPDFQIGSSLIERCGLWSKKYTQGLKSKLHNYQTGWNGKVVLVTSHKMFKQVERIVPDPTKFRVVDEDKLEELKNCLGR